MQDYLNEKVRHILKKFLEGLDALGIPYEVDDRWYVD